MKLKLVSKDWTGVSGEARQDVRYAVGQVTTAPDWNPYPVCGGGIHYAEHRDDWMPEPISCMHLIEVEPVGPTERIEDDKTKAQAVRVLREITAVPTPAEERSSIKREWIASRIPAELLPSAVPTLEQEPDLRTRWCIADRIPRERITAIPTPEQEPSEEVRWHIAGRILADRITAIPTPEQEPDSIVRYRIADRIPLDRLPAIPTPEQEPNNRVRKRIQDRLFGFVGDPWIG